MIQLSSNSLSRLSDFVADQTGLHFPQERWKDLQRGIESAAQEFRFTDPESCIHGSFPLRWPEVTLAHAELLTLQAALKAHPVKWLLDTTLYVTLEPCVMCAGALVLARVKRLVIATQDPKAGACGSIMNVVCSPQLNHRLEVQTGVLRNEASMLLKDFFQKRRQQETSGWVQLQTVGMVYALQVNTTFALRNSMAQVGIRDWD